MKDKIVKFNLTAFRKFCDELGDTPLQKAILYIETFVASEIEEDSSREESKE